MTKPNPPATAAFPPPSAGAVATNAIPANIKRFPGGGGWAVTAVRSACRRASFPANLAKRDGALDQLKLVCERHQVVAWGAYSNQRSPIHYVHDTPTCEHAGEVMTARAGKLALGQLGCGCNHRKAAARLALPIAAAQTLAAERGGTLISARYRNNAEALAWRCAQGHLFWMSYSDAQRGRWCPSCNGPKANILCREILQRLLGVTFELEQTPAFLRAASATAGLPGLLRFDGWCEAERIAFEHQGPQHKGLVVRRNGVTNEPDTAEATRSFRITQ